MTRVLLWGFYIAVAATILFAIFQWLWRWRERRLYKVERELNIAEEQAWNEAHRESPIRKPQLPDLNQGEKDKTPPAQPQASAAKPSRSKKPGTARKASRSARPRAARPPREP